MKEGMGVHPAIAVPDQDLIDRVNDAHTPDAQNLGPASPFQILQLRYLRRIAEALERAYPPVP